MLLLCVFKSPLTCLALSPLRVFGSLHHPALQLLH